MLPRRRHAKVEEDWRGIATVRRDSQDSLDVIVPIRALGDWVQVRQRLGSVPSVKNVAVKQPRSRIAPSCGWITSARRTNCSARWRKPASCLAKDADQWRLQPR